MTTTHIPQPALATRDLGHEYRTPNGPVRVLQGIDAMFPSATWTAIMGPSGSGKSTLLHCCAGLLRATEGSVTLDGVEVTTASPGELTRMRQSRVGFVFQAFNLVPALTAEQNVALPALFAGTRLDRAAVADALARVGLAERAQHRPDQLSGGEQQRVAIARALLMAPVVVFADEPTGALDTRASARVLDEFAGLVAAGTAVVMVTHDPAVAARADRVLFLADGRVAAESSGATRTEIDAMLADLEFAAGRSARS
ncbi:ABC transporter ATP-binding protein [Tessaracoccus caeni]|uniref:ABC transporter ATP-binding protein n=1 Tax=Tessaracoccus caeni TaxID=3031239 RepID=UPI0023DA1924|nr:ABC transporter ATP-binding protein [Tessaracoccus caeni]MDF1488704.1 ABC transporter ATP-binding protein [Tessaracoccus caeni]